MFTLKIPTLITVATLAIASPLASPAVACTGGCDQTTGVCFSANSVCGPVVWKWPPCPSMRRAADPKWLADAPTEMPGRHAAYCISWNLRPMQSVPADTASEQ
jgi:hypothetical protein